jgi:hypothetical protein
MNVKMKARRNRTWITRNGRSGILTIIRCPRNCWPREQNSFLICLLEHTRAVAELEMLGGYIKE